VNHFSLFTGIGGIDLAAEWAGFTSVGMCEIDPYCRKVLRKHWPDVPIWEDVRDVTRESVRARGIDHIDLLTGGFPCQPHSLAGKRLASGDERDLWGEMRRVVSELEPRWVVGENVPGLLSSESGRFFGGVLRDLAALGYRVGWGVWGACDVGANHRRERVFLVGYSNRFDDTTIAEVRGGENTFAGRVCSDVADPQGEQNWRVQQRGFQPDSRASGQDVADTAPIHVQRQYDRPWQEQPWGGSWWTVEPDVGRVAHGVPARVHRLKALGNAVVPQQVYPLLKAIKEVSA
jgi:DNA (cytosine-5)-methyltransferase 1